MRIYVNSGLLSKDTVRSGGIGVYMITFDTGHFYIGSSCQLNWRIRDHIRSLKTNLLRKQTAKSLLRMAGFDGASMIFLVEDCQNAKDKREVLTRERYYIDANMGNPFLLNIR